VQNEAVSDQERLLQQALDNPYRLCLTHFESKINVEKSLSIKLLRTLASVCGPIIVPKNKRNMATVRNNPIVNGLSGMLGQTIVFKNYNGRTFVSAKPRLPKKQSEEQKANRSRFKIATHWAQIILQDPERKAYYQMKAKKLKLPNAYTAAITDYLRKPGVTERVNKTGGITCQVSKRDFDLKKVEVAVTNNEGITETRVIKRNSRDRYFFDLSKEERLKPVRICVTDSAGRLIVIR
jgi:ribosomal protein S10